MSENYNFLRTFTFDGKETNHLFQIAKVNIPFLSKDNEFYSVGNSDGKHFRNSKLGEYSISIDGFVIKDNTGKSVSDSLDELKLLLNSKEPKQLVFDMLPDRYFNAIFSGVQEYDATNLDYTPLTLVFDVPDGLAHSIHAKVYSNTSTTGTNMVLDSEYTNPRKFLAQWATVLETKHDGSAIARGDLTGGLPSGYRPAEPNWYWVTSTLYNRRNIEKLEIGQAVSFSIEAKVNAADDDPNITKAGTIRAELWSSKPLKVVKYIDIDIPKTATTWQKYGTVINVDEQAKGADMINLAYCLNGQASIDFSKPMMALLPDVETKDANEPLVGAKLYSNSIDFGDYDYSGNPNLSAKINASSFSSGTGATVKDENDEIVFTLDGADQLSKYAVGAQTSLIKGKQYTISCEIMLEDGFTGDPSGIRLQHAFLPGGSVVLMTTTEPKNELNKWQKLVGTQTIQYSSTTPNEWYPVFTDIRNLKPTGKVRLRKIKIEEGSTATPYQSNLLDAPYYLSKAPLGENIADPAGIISSSYMLLSKQLKEKIIENQTYTITLKGTKPATQAFRCFVEYESGTSAVNLLDMEPVEGLTDEWQLTFKATRTAKGINGNILVYQVPNTSLGQCKIDWLKIEKGDTRTPNIPYYKYRGLATAPSSNPKDYYWSYTPGYYNAITYSPTGSTIADMISIKNNGTYSAYPTFNFTMNGENGVVALVNDKGGVLQFGNPEDLDGTQATRMDFGLNQSMWGNTLPSNITVNSGFKSVWPYFNGNHNILNIVSGSISPTINIDAITPFFANTPQDIMHGPTVMLPIKAPSTNDRTVEFGAYTRFTFENYSVKQRIRLEFSLNDELGENAMTFIVRDSSLTFDEIILEMWYKGEKLNQIGLDRKLFNSKKFEVGMERLGSTLKWRFGQVNAINNFGNAVLSRQYEFVWQLEEADKTKFSAMGAWFMRHSNSLHTLVNITDMQAKWYNTPFFNNIRNQFQDGDQVTIDVEKRLLLINGVVNDRLNVVGNDWEKFKIEVGNSVVKPIVSEWAEMANVDVTLRETYL